MNSYQRAFMDGFVYAIKLWLQCIGAVLILSAVGYIVWSEVFGT